jgi:hypothetical protein
VLVSAPVLAIGVLPAATAGALPTGYPIPVNVTLQNGWESAAAVGSDPSGKPQVAVDGNGIVHLSGSIYNGSSDTEAFVLPSGDAPASDIWINTLDDGGVADDTYVYINTSGDVYPIGPEVTETTFLSGISFPAASSPLGFSTLSLKNSWVSENSAYDSGNPAVAIDSEGIVHLSGSMAGGSYDTVAFVLPSADRPPAAIYVNTYTNEGTTGSLLIEKNGDVLPFGSDVATYTSLAGITFRSAQSILAANKLTLQNGWTGGGSSTGNPTVTRDQYGFVHLAGSLTNSSDGGLVTVLPKADRPANDVFQTIYTYDGAIGYVVIYSDGGVYIAGQGSSYPYSSDEYSSFCSITFEAGV